MCHEKHLASGIQDLRKNGLLFDYTLVADGESIQVHKVVMAACSDYFRVMLTADMLESKESQVELKEVTARSLRALVDYAYNGELDLSMENIGEIVSSATYFQMKQVVKQCVDFLHFEIFEDNFCDSVDIFNIVSMYSLPITDLVECYIAEQFEKIPGDRLLKLSAGNLAKIIGRGDLSVASEYQLFQKVLSWIRATPDLGEDTIFYLMSKIRFPFMSISDLADVAETEIMKSSSKCQCLLMEAQNYHKDVLKQPLLQTERTQVRSDTDSFIVATENYIYKIDPNNLHVSNLMDTGSVKKEKFYITQLAVTEGFLYVCGTSGHSMGLGAHRFVFSEFFYRFDPRFGKWLKLPTMTGKRCFFELIPCKDFIFAFGGDSEELVEGYSVRRNKWETRTSMNTPRSCMAGAEFNGKIYLCGGSEFSNFPTNYLDCYDPCSDTWESKSPIPHGRSCQIMRRVGDKLYVFGGRSGTPVDYYSPDSDQWTSCTHLKIDVFGAFVSDQIYLLDMTTVGEDEDSSYMLYIYDPQTAATKSLAEELDLLDDELELLNSVDIVNCQLLATPSSFPSQNTDESPDDSLAKTFDGESSE